MRERNRKKTTSHRHKVCLNHRHINFHSFSCLLFYQFFPFHFFCWLIPAYGFCPGSTKRRNKRETITKKTAHSTDQQTGTHLVNEYLCVHRFITSWYEINVHCARVYHTNCEIDRFKSIHCVLLHTENKMVHIKDSEYVKKKKKKQQHRICYAWRML